MKTIKLLSITGLFFVMLVFASCNPHTPIDSQSSSEGIESPSVTNTTKDSTAHNDTIVTPADNNDIKKNNPDITK